MTDLSPAPKPVVGMSVVGTPIVVPENMILRLWTAGSASYMVTLTDRYGGSVGPFYPTGFSPYFNGTNELIGDFMPPYLDFPGSTFATVLPSNAQPYALLLAGKEASRGP